MATADEKFYHAKITKRVDFAPDLWMIRIQAGGEFKFAPGQYAKERLQRVSAYRKTSTASNSSI